MASQGTVSYLVTWQAAGTVAIFAIISPFLSRLLSPFVLLLLSPIFALFILAAFVAASVLIPHALDNRRLPLRQPPWSRHGLGHAGQPLAFSTPAAWQAVLTRSQWSYSSPQSLPPLIPDSPMVSASLNEILVFLVRDFVLAWYSNISPSPSFPSSVSTTIHFSMKSVLTRLDKIDVPSLIVKRILPKINTHIDHFRESEQALRGVRLERRLTASEELDLLLASRYAARLGNGNGAGGRLHPAVHNLASLMTRPTEEVYLRSLVERVLPLVLPPNESGSASVRVAAREIATCIVLMPLMEMLGDPDFWNRLIDQFVSHLLVPSSSPVDFDALPPQAGAAIQQQRLIHKVRNLLDSQSPSSGLTSRQPSMSGSAPRALLGPGGSSEHISYRTGTRQFESFLRSIARCDSLLDARRLRNDIISEIRRTRGLVGGWPAFEES
jgi:sorting nexin-25